MCDNLFYEKKLDTCLRAKIEWTPSYLAKLLLKYKFVPSFDLSNCIL